MYPFWIHSDNCIPSALASLVLGWDTASCNGRIEGMDGRLFTCLGSPECPAILRFTMGLGHWTTLPSSGFGQWLSCLIFSPGPFWCVWRLSLWNIGSGSDANLLLGRPSWPSGANSHQARPVGRRRRGSSLRPEGGRPRRAIPDGFAPGRPVDRGGTAGGTLNEVFVERNEFRSTRQPHGLGKLGCSRRSRTIFPLISILPPSRC